MKNLVSIVFIAMISAATNVSAGNNIDLECECINLLSSGKPTKFSLSINKELETITYKDEHETNKSKGLISAEEIIYRYDNTGRTIIVNRTTLKLSGQGFNSGVKGSCKIKTVKNRKI